MSENNINDQYPDLQELNVDNIKYRTLLTNKYLKRKPFEELDWHKINAFISGTIRKIHVKKGKKVKEGDPLLILEAMKMRNNITSPVDGKVKKVHVKTGDAVAKNQLLVELE